MRFFPFKKVCLRLILSLVLIPYTYATHAMAWEDVLSAMWGEVFTTLNVDVGSVTFHVNNPRGDYKNFYPTLNVNYLGLAVMYFRNTHGDNTYGMGIERYWKEWDILTGKAYLGYRFGGVYGYCRSDWSFTGLYSRCHPRTGEAFPPDYHPKQGVQPIGQLFWTYRKNGLGVMVATAIALTTISMVFYFD